LERTKALNKLALSANNFRTNVVSRVDPNNQARIIDTIFDALFVDPISGLPSCPASLFLRELDLDRIDLTLQADILASYGLGQPKDTPHLPMH